MEWNRRLRDEPAVFMYLKLFTKTPQKNFYYTCVDSVKKLWLGEKINSVEFDFSILNKLPWRLTTDFKFLTMYIALFYYLFL